MLTNGRTVVATATLIVLLTQRAFPTTVVPLSFDQLVQQAEVVFVGEVVDQRSVWNESRDRRGIVTLVTFDVARVLKGQVGLRTQLTFRGGTIGDVTQEVGGMPKFRVGDRDVLFVAPERTAASPLVGFWQGRFRVVRDAASGETQVRTHNGGALISGLGGGALSPTSRQAGRPLALDEFASLVRERVESQRIVR
jgi:hypothetical protein